MSRRRRAREVALQVIYQDDLNPDHSQVTSDRLIRRRLNNDAKLVEFAQSLVAGVRRHRPELDTMLTERADELESQTNGSHRSERVATGAYEIVFSETPNRVAINEAVELAKRFGAQHSAPFVNGILDRLLRETPLAESTADESENPSES